MPATQAALGHAVQLQSGDTAVPAVGPFNTIAEVANVDMSETSDDVDVSNMDSPDATREFIQGLKDGGLIDFTGNFLPDNAAQTLLITDRTARTIRNYQITFPVAVTSKKFSFRAYVKTLSRNLPTESQMKFTGQLKIAGTVTFA